MLTTNQLSTETSKKRPLLVGKQSLIAGAVVYPQKIAAITCSVTRIIRCEYCDLYSI